jgi:hypothetical protein
MRTSLPLDVPNQPAFGRETFKHEIKVLLENLAYDDIYHLNTQSVRFPDFYIDRLLTMNQGTQWDGFRHVRIPSKTLIS